MLGRHASHLVQSPRYWRAFLLAFVSTLVIGGVLTAWGEAVTTAASPLGIVSFEFAQTPENVRAMRAAWGPEGDAAAWRIQWLDMLFLVAYAATLFLAIARLSTRTRGTRAGALAAIAWAMPAAALFDAVENVGLMAALADADSALIALSFYAAAIKFALVAVGIPVALVGLVVELLSRRT